MPEETEEGHNKPLDSETAGLNAGPSEYKIGDSDGHCLSTDLVYSGKN